ncbi:MAG: hypothetical protein SFX73_30225 [Kofleriaceae bacterium]|nr:hypothetical protein [Kofleriaceae bacterium]
MRFLVVLVLSSACWSAPAPNHAVADAPFPGAVWITPRPPWRMTERPTAMVVDGNTAYLAGSEGWVGALDLTTGHLVRERRVGVVSFSALARLRDGRLIAVGSDAELAVAYTLDPATLAATSIPLASSKSQRTYNQPDVALLPDGNVVIAAFGLPLAAYDPKTWERTRELDKEPDWTNLHLVEGALLGTHGLSHFRIDLATGNRTDLKAYPLAGIGSYVVVRGYVSGKATMELRGPDGATVSLPRTGMRVGVDASGRRIASMLGSVVTVTSIPDGKVRGRYDLAPARTMPSVIELVGERLVVVLDATVRVIDLRTGAVTSPGDPPFGSYAHLAVSDDGAVVATGAELWRVIDGKITSGVRVGRHPLLYSSPGELRRYATYTSKEVDDTVAPLVSVVSLDPREPPRSFSMESYPLQGWLGASGAVAVVSGWDSDRPSTLYVSRGKELVEVFAHNLDSTLDDVDVDSGVAALTIAGTTHIVELKGAHMLSTLPMPDCDEYGSAVLERGGSRVVTFSDGDVMLHHRKTGRLLGSLRLPHDLNQPVFIPDHDELILQYTGGFALWSPATGELRTLAVPHLGLVEVSHNAAHLAISLHDGRLALVDFAAVRAAMTPGKAKRLGDQPSCPARDPFEMEADADADADAYEHDEDGYEDVGD